jgi:hypothetical protein
LERSFLGFEQFDERIEGRAQPRVAGNAPSTSLPPPTLRCSGTVPPARMSAAVVRAEPFDAVDLDQSALWTS